MNSRINRGARPECQPRMPKIGSQWPAERELPGSRYLTSAADQAPSVVSAPRVRSGRGALPDDVKGTHCDTFVHGLYAGLTVVQVVMVELCPAFMVQLIYRQCCNPRKSFASPTNATPIAGSRGSGLIRGHSMGLDRQVVWFWTGK